MDSFFIVCMLTMLCKMLTCKAVIKEDFIHKMTMLHELVMPCYLEFLNKNLFFSHVDLLTWIFAKTSLKMHVFGKY